MRDFSLQRRLKDIKLFYSSLDELEEKLGGKRILESCHGKMNWPRSGVYFFFEPGEIRITSGEGLRVVRVGTHGLKRGSNSILWKRLRQHRGTLSGKYAGGGNHRGSIFRLHVGTGFIKKNLLVGSGTETWGEGSSANRLIREKEYWIEKSVSEYIRAMPFLWLDVGDAPGPESLRGYIERNAIALLSNFPHARNSDINDKSIDEPSSEWLGRWVRSDKLVQSGLWNSNHVDEIYDEKFLDILQQHINQMI